METKSKGTSSQQALALVANDELKERFDFLFGFHLVFGVRDGLSQIYKLGQSLLLR